MVILRQFQILGSAEPKEQEQVGGGRQGEGEIPVELECIVEAETIKNWQHWRI